MRLMLVVEETFCRLRDGTYSSYLTYDSFWKRYLNVFETILIVARVRPTDNLPSGYKVLAGENFQILPLPCYHGPYQYLQHMRLTKKTMANAIRPKDCYLFRVPGNLATQFLKLIEKGYPYGLEVMVDPWNAFAPGSVRSLIRPYARWLWTRNLVSQCKKASAVSYVTRYALQKRYPPGKNAFVTNYSSINLKRSDIYTEIGARIERISTLKARLAGKGPAVLLGFIGSFSQLHKLPHVHLNAVADCISRGANINLEMIGEGKMIEDMKKLANQLGIADRVVFRGRLPAGKQIFEAIDRFDLFLNATATEGLPRVVIEAMSRGCPSIASDVGGTCELLLPEFIVPHNNSRALADKIMAVLEDSESMIKVIKRNLAVVTDYCEDVLTPRRYTFYSELRRRTEEYIGRKH
jgi:glycosyltransferase involved in cell wall biosynthesis